MTELRPETAFELQSKVLPADSFYDDNIKKYPIILELISIPGNLKRFLANHIYCQTLLPVILTAYNQ